MTNVPFDEWARPEVRDLLCFAEGDNQRGSRIADLYALTEESTAARVTIWAADILSLMQSAFEEGWQQGATETGDDPPEVPEYDPGPEVDDEGGMSEYRGGALPDIVDPGYLP